MGYKGDDEDPNVIGNEHPERFIEPKVEEGSKTEEKEFWVLVKSEYDISYATVMAKNIREAEHKFLDSFELSPEDLYVHLIKIYDSVSIIEPAAVKVITREAMLERFKEVMLDKWEREL